MAGGEAGQLSIPFPKGRRKRTEIGVPPPHLGSLAEQLLDEGLLREDEQRQAEALLETLHGNSVDVTGLVEKIKAGAFSKDELAKAVGRRRKREIHGALGGLAMLIKNGFMWHVRKAYPFRSAGERVAIQDFSPQMGLFGEEPGRFTTYRHGVIRLVNGIDWGKRGVPPEVTEAIENDFAGFAYHLRQTPAAIRHDPRSAAALARERLLAALKAHTESSIRQPDQRLSRALARARFRVE